MSSEKHIGMHLGKDDYEVRLLKSEATARGISSSVREE